MIVTTIRQAEDGEVIGISVKHEPENTNYTEKNSAPTDNADEITSSVFIAPPKSKKREEEHTAREQAKYLENAPSEDCLKRQFIDPADMIVVEKEPEEVEVVRADSWNILHRYDGKADVVKAKFTCPSCGHENSFAESIPMDDMPAFLMTQISKGVACGWCGKESDIVYTSKSKEVRK